MNDQRSPAIAKKGVAVGSISQDNIIVSQLKFRDALIGDAEIHHVACVMSVGILQTVLFSIGIEMRASGLEIWTVALSSLMKMDPVSPRRQTVQVEVESNARALRSRPTFPYRNLAHAIALGILHLDHRLGRTGERPENDHGQYGCNEKSLVFHGQRLYPRTPVRVISSRIYAS